MDYEEYIFQKYKDRVIKGRKHFINEINSKFRGVDGEKIHREIINYQIKKYGSQLMCFQELSCEQIKRGWTNRKCRRYRNGLKKARRI